jgi:hypothetical protein
MVDPLLEAFWESWSWANELVQKDEKARMILCSSTMAGIVSDAFGHFSRPKLETFKPIWTENGRFRQATIDQLIALRFKKLTPEMRSMNIQTEAQRVVYEQDQPSLSNAQRISAITFGYALDSLASKPTGVYFVCPIDFYRNAWTWSVYQAGGDGQLTLFGSPSGMPPTGKIETVLNVDINVKKRKVE